MNWTAVFVLGVGAGCIVFARPLAGIRYRSGNPSTPPESGVRDTRAAGVLIALLGVVGLLL